MPSTTTPCMCSTQVSQVSGRDVRGAHQRGVGTAETMIWWRPPVTGQGPGPLRAHTATAVGSKIYVFGGGNGSSVSSRVFVFDTGESELLLLKGNC